MSADPDLVLWERKVVPGTSQVLTDVEEATGDLIVEIWGEPPAPTPPSDFLNGVVVAGRVAYQAETNKCILKDVSLAPVT